MRYEVIKRSFDVAVSATALLLLSPVFILTAIAVKCGSSGPSIYKGLRVGRYGKMFNIYKFRSMTHQADKEGSPVTVQNDSRVTRLGRLLRRLKLDELPNLVNVLLGDMSLVGPRPESPEFVKRYTSKQRQVLSVRPGIACLAQIEYTNEESLLKEKALNEREYLKHMASKLELDSLYVQTSSFLGDVSILVCTLLALFGIKINLAEYFRRNLLCHSNLS